MRARTVAWLVLLGCGGSQSPAVENGAAGVRPLFSPGEIVAYAIQAEDGRIVGRTHSRYEEADGKRTIVTRVIAGPPVSADRALAPNRTVEYATTLASDGSPIAFKRLSSADGRMTLSFETNGITRVTDLGTEQIRTSGSVHVLPSDDLVLLALALAKANLAPGQSGKLAVLSPDATIEQPILVQVYADADRRTIAQLPFAKATLNARGQIAELVTSDGRKFVRVEPPGDPPALLPIPQIVGYVRPPQASWIDREIEIPVEEGQLAGVLSEPRLRSKWNRNVVPGIVFLSDLPLQNRHGFASGADYGTWQIFDHLVEQGFAVLRVDDRGVGASKSSIAPENVSLDVQLADAIAMVEAMKKQPAVDAERIFVIGHGWGAVDALMLAKATELAGVVLIAPPLRPAETVLTERARALLGRTPSPAEIDELHRPFAARAEGYSGIDVRALVKDVTEPVAIFQGFKDFEVSWRDDAKPLADAFAKKQAKLFVYEFVDHLLKQESGTSSPARYADAGRRIDPTVLSDLTEWLAEKAQ